MDNINNASAGANGWDGQICQSIWYAFKYLKEMKLINVELHEDIELESENGVKLIQSKVSQTPSQRKPSHNSHFIDGLNSLHNKNSDKYTELIYSTNIYFPVNTMNLFLHNSSKGYSDLDESIKTKIRTKTNLRDVNKLIIRNIPFDGETEDEKAQEMINQIRNILDEIRVPHSNGVAKEMMNEWHRKMFFLASQKGNKAGFPKSDFVWSIVSAVLRENLSFSDLEKLLDKLESQANEYDVLNTIQIDYDRIHDTILSDYKVIIEVITKYTEFIQDNPSLRGFERDAEFTKHYTKDFASKYLDDVIEEDFGEVTANIFVYKIIQKRHHLKRIKEVLNYDKV